MLCDSRRSIKHVNFNVKFVPSQQTMSRLLGRKIGSWTGACMVFYRRTMVKLVAFLNLMLLVNKKISNYLFFSSYDRVVVFISLSRVARVLQLDCIRSWFLFMFFSDCWLARWLGKHCVCAHQAHPHSCWFKSTICLLLSDKVSLSRKCCHYLSISKPRHIIKEREPVCCLFSQNSQAKCIPLIK